jgi:hypothetical protein
VRPDLHSAIDHEVDARHVGALVARQEQSNVGDVLRLTDPAQERPVAHRTTELIVLELPRVELLSIRPGETELTRIPCLLPSTASWRVIPMMAALFVVWAREGSSLKLREPFKEAMLTTTPWVVFR